MGHLNVISFLWLIILWFYIKYVLKQEEEARSKYIKIPLLFVLLYNVTLFFVLPWKFPVELSTTSYYIVPIIVLFGIKKLNVWGVYASVVSGVIYFLAMLIYGNGIYSTYPPYSVYTAIFNHGALLSYAIITLKTVKFEKSERHIIWIGIILSAGWALLLRPYVKFTFRIFIYEVLDGLIVRTYLGNNLIFGYIIYYIVLVTTLILSANMVHKLSRVLYKSDE